jgi:hypothetical protein
LKWGACAPWGKDGDIMGLYGIIWKYMGLFKVNKDWFNGTPETHGDYMSLPPNPEVFL